MSHLLREHAPITDDGWREIDDEARARLVATLATRRLVDFDGPKGWRYSATNLGRVESLPEGPSEAVVGRRRRVLPLVELRASFALSREELASGDRGAEDVDFEPLDVAAVEIASAENIAVFHGWKAAGIVGITEASVQPSMTFSAEIAGSPHQVAKAVELLVEAGVGGPYGLALGNDQYTAMLETTERGGYLLVDHLAKILGGPVVRAPGVRGGVVLSLRGGDFLLDCGQDLAVGYQHHDAESVTLYLEESISFRVVTPEAAVAIDPPA
jgi:uncharacterized linocin/CFP29 family protein